MVLGRKWGEVCVKSYNMIKAKIRIMVCCRRKAVIVCGAFNLDLGKLLWLES